MVQALVHYFEPAPLTWFCFGLLSLFFLLWGHFLAVVLTLNNIGVTNNISMVFPDFPLLTQPEQITGDTPFCNETHKPASCKPHRACFCLHRLKVALNDVVEMSLIDDAEGRYDTIRGDGVSGRACVPVFISLPPPFTLFPLQLSAICTIRFTCTAIDSS